MNDLNMTDFFLTGMITYGPAMLALALLLGALGLPLPGTLFVVAAGALVRQGIIDWSLALGLGLLGVVVGDGVSYVMGRMAKGRVQRRFEQSATWQTVQDTFERCGEC